MKKLNYKNIVMYEMCGTISLFLLYIFSIIGWIYISPHLLYWLLILRDSNDFDKPLHHGILRKTLYALHCKKFYIKHRMWCLNKNINEFPIQHRTWHLNENHFGWFILHIFLIIWGLIVILSLIKRVWNINAHIHICMHKYFLHSTCQYT